MGVAPKGRDEKPSVERASRAKPAESEHLTYPAPQGLNEVIWFVQPLQGWGMLGSTVRRFRVRYAHAPPTVTHVTRLRRCLEC